MTSPEVPEDRLSNLFRLLKKGAKNEAIKLFREHSQRNQFGTFLNMLDAHTYSVFNLGEYIVVFSYTKQDGNHIFVIGLDDNYNFFCHNLPQESTSSFRPEQLTIKAIRDEMGFDYHSWEVMGMEEIPRARIRLQGDIVISVEEIFRNEEELYSFLYKFVLRAFLDIYDDGISYFLFKAIIDQLKDTNKNVEDILNGIRSKLAELSPPTLCRIFEELKSILPKYAPEKIEGFGWNIRNKYIDAIVRTINGYINDTIRRICERENILNLLLGNHQITIIGVSDRDINTILNIDQQQIRGQATIYILRPHTITAMHDEHKTVSLDIPRCVLTISTLRTGPLQMTRHRDIRIGHRRSIRIKAVLINPYNIHPQRILSRNFQGPIRMHLVGGEIYFYRDAVDIDDSDVFPITLVLWYMFHQPRFEFAYPQCYRGARIGLVAVDLSDNNFPETIGRYINDFWVNAEGKWPIILIGYRPRESQHNNIISQHRLEEFINELSKHTVVPSRYVDTYRQNRSLLEDIILECIRDVLRYYKSTLQKR